MMKKIVLTILLLLSFSGARTARAQAVVYDPLQTAQSAIDAYSQLLETMSTFDELAAYADKFTKMKDWFDNSFGEGSWWAQMQGLIKEVKVLDMMVNQLNCQVKMADYYMEQIAHFRQAGYNPWLINNLVNSIHASIGNVTSMIDQAKTILQMAGLSKSEMISKGTELANNIKLQCEQYRDEIDTQMQALEASRSVLSAINFLDGVPESESLDNIGAQTNGTPEQFGGEINDLVEKDKEDFDDVAEDAPTFKLFGSNFLAVIEILLGLICVISIAFALAKYLQGQPGSEQIFVRIAVAAIAGIIVLSILNNIFHFSI